MFAKLEQPCCTDGWFARRQLVKSLAALTSSHSEVITNTPEGGKYVETLKELHAHVQGVDEAKASGEKTADLMMSQQSHKAFRQYQNHLVSTLEQIGAV